MVGKRRPLMRWYVLLGTVVIFTLLALPRSVYACPA
jgi:hypothetical protein